MERIVAAAGDGSQEEGVELWTGNNVTASCFVSVSVSDPILVCSVRLC